VLWSDLRAGTTRILIWTRPALLLCSAMDNLRLCSLKTPSPHGHPEIAYRLQQLPGADWL